MTLNFGPNIIKCINAQKCTVAFGLIPQILSMAVLIGSARKLVNPIQVAIQNFDNAAKRVSKFSVCERPLLTVV